MSVSLRARASIVVLLGVLLIPVATTSLRGLTHVLTCSSDLTATFDQPLPRAGENPPAVLLDPSAVVRVGPGQTAASTKPASTKPATTKSPSTLPMRSPRSVCGGITVDLRLSAPEPGVVRIDLPVKNSGPHRWQGTVRLRVGTKTFPVRIGSIPPRSTRTRSIEVTVETQVERVSGELLVGP